MKRFVKKIILTASIITAVITFQACGSHDHETHDESAAAEHQDHGHDQAGLELNNGKKWIADESTNKNVAALKQIIMESTPASLEDFHNVAEQLKASIQNLVNECRMEGPDHDALHKWLEPLMAKTKNLQNADSEEAAAEIYSDIEKHINIYSDYFQ